MGSHYVGMEKEVTSLLLDLEDEKIKIARLEQEKKTLGGKLFPPTGSYILFLPFDPNHFALTNFRSEKTQPVMTLWTSISLETMKQELENKDKDLALAQKEAKDKTKLADEKLAQSASWRRRSRTSRLPLVTFRRRADFGGESHPVDR